MPHFMPFPTMSPICLGKDPGKGHMLYGSMLDWRELDEPRHRAMFEDVRRMLALRRQDPELLMPQIAEISNRSLWAFRTTRILTFRFPICAWSGNAAVIVLANRNETADARVTLNVLLDKLGQVLPGARYQVTDLWNGGRPRIYTARQLSSFVQVVKHDKTPRGGIGLIKIESIRRFMRCSRRATSRKTLTTHW